VPAVIAGASGEVIAVCDLAVDPVRNRVVDRSHRLEVVFGDVAPDTAMQARVARWNAEIEPLAAEPLGRNAQRLGRSRGGESGVGNLVADAMRAAVGADIAMQNSGGLRADLAAGVVTRGAIYEVLPFENTIVTMTLTGAEVRRALEEALRYERVTQVSGLRYRFDFGAPDFHRVLSIQTADGAPLDEGRSYKVATNNFMAEGGDDYAAFSRARDRADSGITVRSALEDFVRERSRDGMALDVRLDGRAVREPGSRAPSRPD
jgi:2',3'-cyclic-nucleotide 2'-phosphodiesterase (5'-nucleotidase family)